MRIDRHAIIAGLPIKTVRDGLREVERLHRSSDEGWPASRLAFELCISLTHAEWLCDELVAQDILERRAPAPNRWNDFDKSIRYALGEAGTGFLGARMLKRIGRAKVDQIIADLLVRVREINARPELCYFVNEIRLFGSAMDGKAESFGDIDIAYDIAPRKKPEGYKDWHDWSHKRAKLAGRDNLDFFQQLTFAQREMLQLLKNRNQYISLHDFGDIVGIGTKHIQLFLASEGDAEPEDAGQIGEARHAAAMAAVEHSGEKVEQRRRERQLFEPDAVEKNTPERKRERVISAVKSLAFDILRAIDEDKTPPSLAESIKVAHEAITQAGSNEPLSEIVNLSFDALTREPDRFISSFERRQNSEDGTDKKNKAENDAKHAVLKEVKDLIFKTKDQEWGRLDLAFNRWRHADHDKYDYQQLHGYSWRGSPWQRARDLSGPAVDALEIVAGRKDAGRKGPHKQGVKTLLKEGFIKPFRKKWKLTPQGHEALQYLDELAAYNREHSEEKGPEADIA